MIDRIEGVIVMPACNGEQTLRQTVAEVPPLVDEIIAVDDCSRDATTELARRLGLHTIVHENRGYGGNRSGHFAPAAPSECSQRPRSQT